MALSKKEFNKLVKLNRALKGSGKFNAKSYVNLRKKSSDTEWELAMIKALKRKK